MENDVAVIDPPTRRVAALPPSDITPMFLLAIATENNRPIEEVERFMVMVKQWEDRQALVAFNDAMAKTQAEMKAVAKTKFNSHTKSHYAELGDMISEIAPIYGKNGISIMYYEGPEPPEGHVRVMVDISHEKGHVKTRQLDMPLDGQGMKGNTNMTPLQGKGSSIAYGRRYLTAMIFNLPTGDDRDGNRQQQQAPKSAPINPDQIAVINGLLDDCHKAGKPVDFHKFLEWLKVERLDLLLDSEFTKAVKMLTDKLRLPPPTPKPENKTEVKKGSGK